jgi:hypothetical protein
MIWKRSEDRPSALDKFKDDLARVIAEAEDAGVLSVHIGRLLRSQSEWQEHRASLRSAAMGGR